LSNTVKLYLLGCLQQDNTGDQRNSEADFDE